MYCQLCHIKASPTHNSSSGHHAARELAAVAVDRLTNLAASEDSTEEGTSEVAKTDKTVKTPEAVGFCDSCNLVIPITEHSSHLRTKDHTLMLLNEQTFEELVQAYLGEEPKLEPIEPTDDGAFVDETEAANTYTCHICNLQVPRVFKSEHERGSWHRVRRILTLAAARRARDMISARPCEPKDGESEFNGKMMKALLKLYGGEYVHRKNKVIEAEGEPEPQPERLTAKAYFTDILPFLPYIGAFYNLIIDDTEYVTIQITNETLKIHVNNLNGLSSVEGNVVHYMNCRLCDGFTNTPKYLLGHEDKLHLMSLGHIKNVLAPIDSVHLIRRIDGIHSICLLCNVHIAPHLVDTHIFKDTRHTMALSEALERGKAYEENKEHLKIMIYMPPAEKQSIFMKPHQFNEQRWTFGFNQQPKHFSGMLFGGGQNTGFGSAQNTGFGSAQSTGFGSSRNTAFGSAQNTGFGSAKITGFGSAQNAGFSSAQTIGFGSAQNTGFGSAQQNTGFGSAQNTGFGSAQQNIGFGSAQNTGFGSPQNTSFNSAQKTGFGSTQNTGFGGTQNTAFSSAQNTGFHNAQVSAQHPSFVGAKSSVFGAAQTQGQSSASTHQNTTNFGTGRNSTCSFGNSPTTTGYSGYGDQNKRALFGNGQNNTASCGAAQPAQGNAQPNPVSGEPQGNSVSGSDQNTNLTAQNQGQSSEINNGSAHQNTTKLGTAFWNNTANTNTGSLGNQANATGFGAQNNSDVFGSAQNTATFGAAQPAKSNAQVVPVSGEPQSNTVFGSAQNIGGPFGNAQNSSGVIPQKKIYEKRSGGMYNRLIHLKAQNNTPGFLTNKPNSTIRPLTPKSYYSSSSDSD